MNTKFKIFGTGPIDDCMHYPQELYIEDLFGDWWLETMNGPSIPTRPVLKLLVPDLVKQDSFKVNITMEFS